MHIQKKVVTPKTFKKVMAHLRPKSDTHKEDTRFTDPLQERSSVLDSPPDFDVEYRGGVSSEAEFEQGFEDASIPLYKGPKRSEVGVHFVFSPPDYIQASLHTLPARMLKSELQEVLEIYDRKLQKEFGDMPRALAIHTDKVRIHVECIMLKYLADGQKNPSFSGINDRERKPAAIAAYAALYGGRYSKKEFHARLSHAISSELIERVRGQNSRLIDTSQYGHPPTEECIDAVSSAFEYRVFLENIASDETLKVKNRFTKARLNAGQKAEDFSQSAAHEELCLLFGKGCPLPDPQRKPRNFILSARLRLERTLARRRRERETDLSVRKTITDKSDSTEEEKEKQSKQTLWARMSRFMRMKVYALARKKNPYIKRAATKAFVDSAKKEFTIATDGQKREQAPSTTPTPGFMTLIVKRHVKDLESIETKSNLPTPNLEEDQPPITAHRATKTETQPTPNTTVEPTKAKKRDRPKGPGR